MSRVGNGKNKDETRHVIRKYFKIQKITGDVLEKYLFSGISCKFHNADIESKDMTCSIFYYIADA